MMERQERKSAAELEKFTYSAYGALTGIVTTSGLLSNPGVIGRGLLGGLIGGFVGMHIFSGGIMGRVPGTVIGAVLGYGFENGSITGAYVGAIMGGAIGGYSDLEIMHDYIKNDVESLENRENERRRKISRFIVSGLISSGVVLAWHYLK